jgi:cytidylate kinase
MIRFTSVSEHVRPILAAIRTVPLSPREHEDLASPPIPFVTLSREPGTGAPALAESLASALNEQDPAEQPWTCWDRELVEKFSADHHLSQRLVESLQEREHSWLSDFFAGIGGSDSPDHADEPRIFRGVATTVQALASTGRVIIVGRGGVFLTRRLPGGVHIRLVAPLEFRIERYAKLRQISSRAAADELREITRRREAFYRRYWPGEPIRPELFHAMINVARVSQQTIVQMVVALVKEAKAAASRGRSALT